jgi:starch synthase
MKVLFATWELDPFFKLGGLGDVSRSLPAALRQSGVDIRVILPFYKVVRLGNTHVKRIGELSVRYDGILERVEIFEVIHPTAKVPVYLIRNKKYLDIAKSPDTFAFFNKVIADFLIKNCLSWIPDIVHCNDHHTGLVPLLIKERQLPTKSIITIHNLSYQGRSSVDVLRKMQIDVNSCKVLSWEIASDQVNFLMEGIIHADVVTTVSPTYAREIMQEEFGMGLEEILRAKEGRVFGILNGIDAEFNTFLHMKSVKYPYITSGQTQRGGKKIYSWEEGKRLNKLYLQKELGLGVGESIPLLSFIGRFDPWQKGMDILHKMMRRIDIEKYEFAILGTGNPEWEERFCWFGKFYPENVSCNFKFDDTLAHRIYAASEFMIIPSTFEPCGLVQLIAMSHGTIPIARRTGGLIDSISDEVNGFLFKKNTSESLGEAVKKAIDIWRDDKPRYRIMVEAAMLTDFSWKRSAAKYLDLYNKLVSNVL